VCEVKEQNRRTKRYKDKRIMVSSSPKSVRSSTHKEHQSARCVESVDVFPNAAASRVGDAGRHTAILRGLPSHRCSWLCRCTGTTGVYDEYH